MTSYTETKKAYGTKEQTIESLKQEEDKQKQKHEKRSQKCHIKPPVNVERAYKERKEKTPKKGFLNERGSNNIPGDTYSKRNNKSKQERKKGSSRYTRRNAIHKQRRNKQYKTGIYKTRPRQQMTTD